MNFNIEKFHLKSVLLFDFLSKEESWRIKGEMIRKEYLKGEFLFKEKSYSKGIYIIRKGKVKIFQTNSEGKCNIVYIYKKGDFFGYRPLLANEPNPVAAVALDHVSVSFIPKELFLKLLNDYPFLAKQLLVNLSKEFSVWINKMTVFSQYGVRERVALSLLILNRVYQKNDDDLKSSAIALNREDFANFVGTAKETLVRMLRNFKNEKIITTIGTKIVILKHGALLSMVSEM